MAEIEKATVLVVDDEPINLMVLSDLLKTEYRVIAAKNGAQALARANGSPRPELILLDIMMPEMDGFEVCQQLKSDPATADIPIIFVSAMNEERDEEQGLTIGAVDYLTKPISPAIVTARVRNHIALKAAQDQLSKQNEILEEQVKQRTAELIQTQGITIHALASLAETRDNETGNHIRRTQHYVKTLAEELASQGLYPEQLTPANIDLLYKSAPLHDIGKVGIPDSILLKPGKLTADEFEIMKTHAALGAEAIIAAEEAYDADESSFLRYAREIAACHHEKWNGQGYPKGLAGETIPLSGRLMAVADVYDALICKRIYKPPMGHDRAKEIICEGRGEHFDPAVVDAFLRVEEEFKAIARRFED